jgi:hypothetical protein
MTKKAIIRGIMLSSLFLAILLFLPIYPSAKYEIKSNANVQELELKKEFRASLHLNIRYGFEHSIPSSPQYVYKRSKNFLFVYLTIAIIGIGSIFGIFAILGQRAKTEEA